MPKGTRVHRCVDKLTERYGYSGAIGICQKSTHQNYMTGKRLRKIRKKSKKRKKKKPGSRKRRRRKKRGTSAKRSRRRRFKNKK